MPESGTKIDKHLNQAIKREEYLAEEEMKETVLCN